MVPVIAPEEMAQDLGISPTNKYYEICLRRRCSISWSAFGPLFDESLSPSAV